MTAPRILYVDDDAGLCRLAQRALERRGFSVETALSADAGLAKIAEERFDLVAIDNHMPGKSGRQMLDQIVAEPGHPPVVFVTGNDDTGIAVEALHAGALDFVVKTVGESFFDTLDGRFRQALSRDGLEREKRAAEAELRQANDRLEMLVREVHHRVSNSLQMVLSFVSMQAHQTDDEAARDALEATQNRIRAIAKVHHRLYTRDDLTTIDLDAYLLNLADELRESMADRAADIALELDAEPVETLPDVAVSVGVIVNELVSNAAKYAFAPGRTGRILVSLARIEGGFSVTVADDGDGFDSEDAPQGTGLGTRIMSAIARSLGTEVVEQPCERGSAFTFTVQSKRPASAGK